MGMPADNIFSVVAFVDCLLPEAQVADCLSVVFMNGRASKHSIQCNALPDAQVGNAHTRSHDISQKHGWLQDRRSEVK